MERWSAFLVASALFVLLTLSSSTGIAQSPRRIQLESTRGFPSIEHTDWLGDPNTLFVAPSQSVTSTIRVITFTPPYQYTGRVRLSVTCCYIPDTLIWVGTGVEVYVGATLTAATLPRLPLDSQNPPGQQIIPPYIYVDVPGQSVEATLYVTAGPNVTPGNWEARIAAENPNQGVNEYIRVMINVLPAWPPDGAAPACMPGLEVISLNSIKPPPYTWKANNLGNTSYYLGIKSATLPIGMDVTIKKAPVFPRLEPTEAIITFKNTRGWPVGIRKSDSRSCAVTNPTTTVYEGQTATIRINRTDTTTLVFSKSTCRFWFIGCWSVGMDDIFQFSEGPFWTLFGGKQADIETVKDWGKVWTDVYGSY